MVKHGEGIKGGGDVANNGLVRGWMEGEGMEQGVILFSHLRAKGKPRSLSHKVSELLCDCEVLPAGPGLPKFRRGISR